MCLASRGIYVAIRYFNLEDSLKTELNGIHERVKVSVVPFPFFLVVKYRTAQHIKTIPPGQKIA